MNSLYNELVLDRYDLSKQAALTKVLLDAAEAGVTHGCDFTRRIIQRLLPMIDELMTARKRVRVKQLCVPVNKPVRKGFVAVAGVGGPEQLGEDPVKLCKNMWAHWKELYARYKKMDKVPYTYAVDRDNEHTGDDDNLIRCKQESEVLALAVIGLSKAMHTYKNTSFQSKRFNQELEGVYSAMMSGLVAYETYYQHCECTEKTLVREAIRMGRETYPNRKF